MTAEARPGLTLRDRRFDWGSRTYVMGIVNVSPESFSGDGLASVEDAVAQAARFEAEGADIIDAGGQSTRPAVRAGDASRAGFELLSVEEEVARVVPAIEGIVAATSLPVSIDAYRAPVVAAALDAGAHLVNDIWGFRHDAAVAKLAAQRGVPAIAMHNQRGREFHDVIGDVTAGFKETLRIADEAGLSRNRLILDPGFGFGWSVDQNLEMLRRLAELRTLGLPLLLGTSRKSTIGAVLGLPEAERIWGTAATVALSIAHGADIVRVHDVAAMKQVCVMTDAIVRPLPSP
jgi:dihydropteroate synthase